MKTGAELISEERIRQIEVEGYDKEHDSDEYYHDVDAFVKAAVSYAIIDLKGSEKSIHMHGGLGTEFLGSQKID